MARMNTDFDVEQKYYRPNVDGAFGGTPTVTLELGNPSQTVTIDSIHSQLEAFGWKKKVRDGHAILEVAGASRNGPGQPHDPLFRKHSEALEVLHSVVNPHLFVARTRGQRVPAEIAQDIFDHYTVVVTNERLRSMDDSDEVLQWFANRSRYDNEATFIVDIERISDEGYLQDLSRSYIVPDENFWLRPTGDIDNVRDVYGTIKKISKRNRWNVSPRLDLFEPVEKEEADDDEE